MVVYWKGLDGCLSMSYYGVHQKALQEAEGFVYVLQSSCFAVLKVLGFAGKRCFLGLSWVRRCFGGIGFEVRFATWGVHFRSYFIVLDGLQLHAVCSQDPVGRHCQLPCGDRGAAQMKL